MQVVTMSWQRTKRSLRGPCDSASGADARQWAQYYRYVILLAEGNRRLIHHS